jgi:ApbE superfamily uncharacterized protein (UPF0280 family)
MRPFVLNKVVYLRNVLDTYIAKRPEFLTSLVPIDDDIAAHQVIRSMIQSSAKAGIGPMSAVAGVFAQFVGEALISEFRVSEVIVENGGDLYLQILNDLEVGIYAGHSPLSNKLAVIVPASLSPLGLCTSSGTVGHSLSFGKADAAMIACNDASLADALATRFGNEVKTPLDIPNALKLSENFPEILSVVIIIEDKIGVKGLFGIQPVL